MVSSFIKNVVFVKVNSSLMILIIMSLEFTQSTLITIFQPKESVGDALFVFILCALSLGDLNVRRDSLMVLLGTQNPLKYLMRMMKDPLTYDLAQNAPSVHIQVEP